MTGTVRQSVQFEGEEVRELNLNRLGTGLIVQTSDAATESRTIRILVPDPSSAEWTERLAVERAFSDVIAWSPDHRAVAFATQWDEQRLRVVPLEPHSAIVTAITRRRLEQVAFARGGDRIIGATTDRLDVFDAASGRRIERVRVPDLRWMDVNHATGECVVVRNRYDILAPIEGILEVRPASDAIPTRTCRIPRRSIEHVAVSPDVQKFAAVLIGRDAETFEFREREIAVIERSDDPRSVLRRVNAPLSASALAFSPDSSCLAVALRTGVVEIWDVARLPLDDDR